MKIQLNQKEWLAVDPMTKNRLREAFKIPRTGVTETVNGQLVSDGTTDRDLAIMDIGKMIEFLGPELSFWREDLFTDLFSKTLDKVYGKRTEPAVGTASTAGTADGSTEGTKPRRGRPPRQATPDLPKLA